MEGGVNLDPGYQVVDAFIHCNILHGKFCVRSISLRLTSHRWHCVHAHQCTSGPRLGGGGGRALCSFFPRFCTCRPSPKSPWFSRCLRIIPQSHTFTTSVCWIKVLYSVLYLSYWMGINDRSLSFPCWSGHLQERSKGNIISHDIGRSCQWLLQVVCKSRRREGKRPIFEAFTIV